MLELKQMSALEQYVFVTSVTVLIGASQSFPMGMSEQIMMLCVSIGLGVIATFIYRITPPKEDLLPNELMPRHPIVGTKQDLEWNGTLFAVSGTEYHAIKEDLLQTEHYPFTFVLKLGDDLTMRFNKSEFAYKQSELDYVVYKSDDGFYTIRVYDKRRGLIKRVS